MPPKSTKRKYEPLKKKNFDLQADVLDKLTSNDINCWIDGACKGNPGPAGAGCFMQIPELTVRNGSTIFHTIRGVDGTIATADTGSGSSSLITREGKEEVKASNIISTGDDITIEAMDFGEHKFIGARSTNGISELMAVELALDMLANIEAKLGIRLTNPVNLMTDSTYCLGAFNGNNAKANQEIILRIKNRIKLLTARGIKVTFHWVEAHCGIYGNEMADWLANQAVWLSGIDIIAKYLAEFRKSGLAEYLVLDTFSAIHWQSVVRIPYRLWEVNEASTTAAIVNAFISKRTEKSSKVVVVS